MLYLYFAAALALVSLITFILYGLDKYKARHGLWRIPEKVLLGFSFFGGALGGILGMSLFRHKTKREHWYFRAVNALGLLWPIALLALIFFF
jgi:uncharacterized membrane protein YsdA (DUF1294 family)